MKYSEHVDKWKDCERCPLHERRKRVVSMRGTIPADVLFIGEAPGPSEDVIGKPFVGPAGQILDRIIESVFEPSVRLAFCNLVGCIPLDDGSDKFAEPPEESIRKCSPKLLELVTMAKPKVVVCVGKLASKWVRKEPTLSFRGTAGGFKRIDIQHPASILRTGIEQRGLLIHKCKILLVEALEYV